MFSIFFKVYIYSILSVFCFFLVCSLLRVVVIMEKVIERKEIKKGKTIFVLVGFFGREGDVGYGGREEL